MTHDEVERRIEADRRAHLARDRDQLVGVVQRVQIGAADPARLDRDQHVARAEHGIGDVLDDENTTTGDGGTHGGETTGRSRLWRRRWNRTRGSPVWMV